VLCYFPVALRRSCQQKQLRERTQREENGYMAPGMLEKQETVSDAGMQTLAHNLSKPF